VDYIVSNIFEMCEFIYLYHIEIQVSLLRHYLNYEVRINIKLADYNIFDFKFTDIVHGK
jgi:hypothetical protein